MGGYEFERLACTFTPGAVSCLLPAEGTALATACNCTQNTKSPSAKFVSFRAACWGADDVRVVGNQHGPDPIQHSPCHFCHIRVCATALLLPCHFRVKKQTLGGQFP
jgi:hypothetical protein